MLSASLNKTVPSILWHVSATGGIWPPTTFRPSVRHWYLDDEREDDHKRLDTGRTQASVHQSWPQVGDARTPGGIHRQGQWFLQGMIYRMPKVFYMEGYTDKVSGSCRGWYTGMIYRMPKVFLHGGIHRQGQWLQQKIKYGDDILDAEERDVAPW